MAALAALSRICLSVFTHGTVHGVRKAGSFSRLLGGLSRAVPCARQRETFLSHRLSSSLQHLVLSSQLPLGYSLPIHCVTRPAQWGLEEEGLSITQCHPGQGGGGVMGAGAPHPAGGAWESSHPRLSVAVFLHLILPSQGATHSNFNQDCVQSARHFTLPREALFLCPSEQTRSESGQGPVQNSGFNSEVSTGLSPRSQAPDGRDPDGVTESTRDLSYS